LQHLLGPVTAQTQSHRPPVLQAGKTISGGHASLRQRRGKLLSGYRENDVVDFASCRRQRSLREKMRHPDLVTPVSLYGFQFSAQPDALPKLADFFVDSADDARVLVIGGAEWCRESQ
jgi:hypothetical protein